MRIVAKIEYQGTNYHGFERQKSGIATIQQELEIALSKIANSKIHIVVAGRTDTGVHATGQIIHFDTKVNRPTSAWILGTNSILPPDISVISAQIVSNDFHARFSATARIYQYHIISRSTKVVLNAATVFWTKQVLDTDKMQIAANFLIGEHDFLAFRAASCQANTSNRNIKQITIQKIDNKIITTIKANAFLHHMVRNIMGSLLLVGQNKQPAIWLQQLLIGKDRSLAGPTISARGLRLVKVEYPQPFNNYCPSIIL